MAGSTSGRFIWSLVVIFGFVINCAQADNLFAGCYSIYPSAQVAKPNQADAAGCTTACVTGATTYTHSYYNATGRQCFCSNGTPSGQYLVDGNADGCGLNYDNRNTRTTFMQWSPPCFDSLPRGLTRTSTNPTGLNACLRTCAFSTMATFWRPAGSATYACACGVPTGYGNPVTCGTNSYFEFYHTPEAAVSGLTRRKQKEEVRRLAQRHATLYCPRGWTACNVEGASEDSYECIDVRNELESCGGCMSGQYGTTNGTIGEDCSKGNAAFGRSTCREGRCVASACKRGYELSGERCVPKRR